jgi:hypothetical protein
MDERALAAAFRVIVSGFTDAIAALEAPEPEGDQEQREIELMREFDREPGRGLNQAQASLACKRLGFTPQTVGAWVRGGWVEMKDDRRYLSASGRKWLAERGIPTLG